MTDPVYEKERLKEQKNIFNLADEDGEVRLLNKQEYKEFQKTIRHLLIRWQATTTKKHTRNKDSLFIIATPKSVK